MSSSETSLSGWGVCTRGRVTGALVLVSLVGSIVLVLGLAFVAGRALLVAGTNVSRALLPESKTRLPSKYMCSSGSLGRDPVANSSCPKRSNRVELRLCTKIIVFFTTVEVGGFRVAQNGRVQEYHEVALAFASCSEAEKPAQ